MEMNIRPILIDGCEKIVNDNDIESTYNALSLIFKIVKNILNNPKSQI